MIPGIIKKIGSLFNKNDENETNGNRIENSLRKEAEEKNYNLYSNEKKEEQKKYVRKTGKDYKNGKFPPKNRDDRKFNPNKNDNKGNFYKNTEPVVVPESKKEPEKKEITISSFNYQPKKYDKFTDFALPIQLLQSVRETGYKKCTAFQTKNLLGLMEGKDTIMMAEKQSGKTAAYLIASYYKLLNNPKIKKEKATPRTLIICHNKEQVLRVTEEAKNLNRNCKLGVEGIFGGTEYAERKLLLMDKNVDVLVSTPGIILDFVLNEDINFGEVEVCIIDDLSKILETGFKLELTEVLKSVPPKNKKQAMVFYSEEVPEIEEYQKMLIAEPKTEVKKVPKKLIKKEPKTDSTVQRPKIDASKVEQKVFLIEEKEKFNLLNTLFNNYQNKRFIVFCKTEEEALNLSDRLKIYSHKYQFLSFDTDINLNKQYVEDFKNGSIKILIGIDNIMKIVWPNADIIVVNYSFPRKPIEYVNRIIKAGQNGLCILFASEHDSVHIPDIEKFLKIKLNYITPDINYSDDL